MDWIELVEDFWDEVKERGYYIVGVAVIILFPFILGAPGLSQVPILTDIYSLGRSVGLFDANTYVLKIVSLCLIWAIFAASWDLLSGYTGQVSFGHAIFWGLAAYATFWVANGFDVIIPLVDTSATVDIGMHSINLNTSLSSLPVYESLMQTPLIGVILGIIVFFLELILNGIAFLINGTLNLGSLLIGTGLNVIIGIINPILQFFLGSHFVLDPFTALLFGGVFAALIALFIGLIALRVKGPYLALVTLVIPIIVAGLVPILKELFGPSFGIPNVPSIIESVGVGVDRYRELDAMNFYNFTMIMFFISVGIMMLIAFSRIGLAFQSIREDEDAAESLGINLRNYKILAFMISAFFAGIAGGLYSQWLDFTGPALFGSGFSFSVIIMVVIGGVGSISGGIIGAFLLTILVELFLDSIFQGVFGLDILAYGLLLIFTLRYMRFGLARATKEQKRACVVGILFALSWTIIMSSDILEFLVPLSIDGILTFVGLVIMLILTIPAIPVFIVSEIVGLVFLQGIVGLSLSSSALLKAKFIIYAVVGIPFSYYLPKIFKKVRLRFWGVWPSVGRYEPD
ncbi:MAG: branched-chain amino acid ABC transporter permease [Candidatus Hodarchaeales archaeon]|jgi:branched-chain amino acid transport system permease protein